METNIEFIPPKEGDIWTGEGMSTGSISIKPAKGEDIHRFPDFSMSRSKMYLFFLFHKILFWRKHKDSMAQWMQNATHCTPDYIFWNSSKKRFVLSWNYDNCEYKLAHGKSYDIPVFLQ